MNVSNRTYNVIILATALTLFLAVGAAAFDYSDVSSAPLSVIQCMGNKLDSETMKFVLTDKRPSDRDTRKSIKEAYETCINDIDIEDHEKDTVYNGPLFDAMSQIDETVKMRQAIEGVRKAGVSKIALFARSRKKLHQNEQAVLDLAKKIPDLIVLGAPKYFQLSGDLPDAFIQATVEGIKKHNYRFIGEILYTHGDKKSGKQYSSGERYVDPSKPGTAKLLKAIAPLNIPVMVHWEAYAPERDFPLFHTLYSAWPDQIFMLPHMGFASAAQINDFMGKHPNFYALTSKKERFMGNFSDPDKRDKIGASMLEGNTLRPEWKKLLIKYQDRILFATDPHMKKLWQYYGEIVDRQRLILGQLPPDVAEKIAYKNAEKIYGVRLNQ